MLSGPDPAQRKTFSKNRRAPRNMEVHFRSNSSKTSDPSKSSNKVPDYYTEMLGFKISFSTTSVQRNPLHLFPSDGTIPAIPGHIPAAFPAKDTDPWHKVPQLDLQVLRSLQVSTEICSEEGSQDSKVVWQQQKHEVGECESQLPESLLCAILPQLCSAMCLAPVRCWLWSLNISIKP